jgi:thiol-disulfide isomerase/thioredoxin
MPRLHRRSFMRQRIVLSSLALVALLATGAVAFAASKAGGRAPEFALKDANGKEVKLTGLRGKVVLVDFWASWCKPCKKELPELDKLAKIYKTSGADVEIVAINIDTKRDNADKFLKGAKIASLTILFDPSSTSAEQYEPSTMPTSFLIDKKGIVKVVHEGYNSGDEKTVRREIDGLLNQPAQ